MAAFRTRSRPAHAQHAAKVPPLAPTAAPALLPRSRRCFRGLAALCHPALAAKPDPTRLPRPGAVVPRRPTDPFGTCALPDCSSLWGGGWCATLVYQNLSLLEIQVRMYVLESLVQMAQILTLC